MLPALDRLSLSRTGEFYPLSQAEVDALNKDCRNGWGGPLSADGSPRDIAHPLYPFGAGRPAF